jgi:hypothetical protein
MRRLVAVLATLALLSTGFATPSLASYHEDQAGGGQDDQAQGQQGDQGNQADGRDRTGDRGADRRPAKAMGPEDREDGTIDAHLAEAGGVLFQARPDAPGEQVIQRALEHAAEQDELGGEARVAGADAEAVLSSGEARSSFHAEEAGEGLQVIVNLESFSEHDVTVQPTEDDTTDDTDEGTDGTDDTTDDGADTAGDEAPAPSLAVLVAALVGLGALVRRP